ncbi:MAG: GNAT family N-acetyltransferase [Alphaproteobacteria bacterium]|nr:GNAT family N-acetyltransferase [Alphaproteobacteria bacterium]
MAAWTKAMPAIDFEARRAWFVDHLCALHARGVRVTCAFDVGNGDMAGFITLDDATGHIDQLAAAPVYWGDGAAMTLLAEAKRAARRLHVDVNQDNARALSFYEREGFRRTAAGVNSLSGLRTWHFEWCA